MLQAYVTSVTTTYCKETGFNRSFYKLCDGDAQSSCLDLMLTHAPANAQYSVGIGIGAWAQAVPLAVGRVEL